MKCSLGISNFLEEILVFQILFFSSVSLCWSLRKSFLSLFAILWNSAFKWVYISFSPLLFASLLFTAICKACSDSRFGFLHFFFLGMVLLPVSCTMSWTSIRRSSVGYRNLQILTQSTAEKGSGQFSSVAQSCPTLCDPMNCSTPGLLVHHQLPEFTQTQVHWVSDAIQPSHPL